MLRADSHLKGDKVARLNLRLSRLKLVALRAAVRKTHSISPVKIIVSFRLIMMLKIIFYHLFNQFTRKPQFHRVFSLTCLMIFPGAGLNDAEVKI